MSGGVAYVHDPHGAFPALVNYEMVELEPLEADDLELLERTIARHVELTGSTLGARILASWSVESPHFRKVMPKDYKRVLAVLREAEALGLDEAATAAKVMEAAHG
jgi:glutamate synthase (NADPH/NADH) large chain